MIFLKQSKFTFIIIFIYRRRISFEQGIELKIKLGFDYFMEVSSKNAKCLFYEAAKTLYEDYLKIVYENK